MRYCTNHHTFHDESEFESHSAKSERTKLTTCARARDLALTRFKRRREASAAAAAESGSGGSVQLGPSAALLEGVPALGDASLLQLPPLPVAGWGDDVEDALLGWPWGDDSDPFGLLPPGTTPPVLPKPPSPMQSLVQPREMRTVVAAPEQQASVVGPVLSASLTIQNLATSPQTATYMRCVAGDRAKAHAEECPAAAAQYACAWRLIFPLRQRQSRNLAIVLERLQGVVLQARRDVLARGRANITTGEELLHVLDAMHDLAGRRRLALATVADSRLLSNSIALLIQELRDGNEVLMCNLAAVLALLQSSAASGNVEVHAEVVRLVAEFALLQLGLAMSALSERNAWMDGLRGGGRNPEQRRLAALAGNCVVDIRRGWDGLLQHWQAWVIPREDEFLKSR